MHHPLAEDKPFFDHCKHTAGQVARVVYARVVFTNKLQFAGGQHVGHASADGFALLDVGWRVERFVCDAKVKHLFQIDPAFEVARHGEVLVLTLSLHLVAIEITTGREHKFCLKYALCLEELANLR